MRGLWVMAGLLCASTATAEPAWRTPGQDEANTARQLASTGRCSEALDYFDRAVETRAEDASLRRDRGLCHEQLGDPAPAIEDYRAYLSMASGARDATAIRERLHALEGSQAPSAPSTDTDAVSAPGGAVLDDGRPAGPERIRQTGWLVGGHIGVRGWSHAGYSKPTVAYGVEGAWAAVPHFQIDARLVLLSTNVDDTAGFGMSLGGAWKTPLDDTRRLELLLGAGAGYESESDDAGIPRKFVFLRFTPALRCALLSSVLLDVGPELALGSIQRASDSASYESAPGSHVSTLYYGLHLELMWLLGG